MPAAKRPLFALSVVLLLSWSMPSAWCRSPQADPHSEPPEAQRLLAAVHDYAAHYVSTLPDFVCLQTIEQFQSGKKADRWRQLDTLASRLVFAGGREHRTLELVNGHKPSGARMTRRPLTTEGEFAILVSNIFGESSQAQFEWQDWQVLRGQRCAVFRYRIAQEHSTMKLSLSDLATATVGYSGQVFAEEGTGSIRRVTSEATDIPAQVQTRKIATVIDYWPVTVGTGLYMLPSDASVQVETPSGHVRNVLHFSDYQKFEAASTITFDSDPGPATKTPPQNFE